MTGSNDSSGGSRKPSGPVLEEWKRTGRDSELTIAGGSMRPLFGKGSRVIVRPVTDCPVRGDIVAYMRHGGLTVHRIVRVFEQRGARRFIAKGDAAFGFDPEPVDGGMIVGRVVGIERKGSVIDLETPRWRLYGRFVARCSYIIGSAARIMRPVTALSKKRRRPAGNRRSNAR
ncbi:MAG: S24/S26 family peptidase [bacterium]|nr:MAG: S24/S26 family peptidase [bacterium]